MYIWAPSSGEIPGKAGYINSTSCAIACCSVLRANSRPASAHLSSITIHVNGLAFKRNWKVVAGSAEKCATDFSAIFLTTVTIIDVDCYMHSE